MTAFHVIPAFKKIGELLGDYLAGVTGIEIVSYRISPWGPGGNPASPFSAVPQIVHAAARGVRPDFSALAAAVHAMVPDARISFPPQPAAGSGRRGRLHRLAARGS
jgi:UDP-glucose 4-epimerase